MPFEPRHQKPPVQRALVRIGADVRQARYAAGLSQQALADRVGVAQSTISRLERGCAPGVGLWVIAATMATLGFRSLADFRFADLRSPRP
ncbi:MAG: helix-turn-helix transcriptional regulator [Chloroflexi bacterium]|nr:helix-turn-helix transcriptional regulator [Chloroflexota bacterium]